MRQKKGYIYNNEIKNMAQYIEIHDLKKLRTEINKGVISFSKLCNISANTVKAIESGKSVHTSKLEAYLIGLGELYNEIYYVVIKPNIKE